jgi:FtsP/CotA-like multicopper oxidase with cupredoxin domain
MLKSSHSSTRWALIFLMGTGFAMTLITTGSPQPLPTCFPAVQPPGFPLPPVRQSLNGLLQTTLKACISTIVMVDQNQVPPVTTSFNPPTFEGSIPAPTLSVKPGDKLVLFMNNTLPSNPSGQREGHFPHDPYTFNLHTHGLTVSPNGMSDNIFREMAPNGVYRVEVNIPQDHPSGTFWYHVHKHGSATFQFNSGMAGFLIVQGGPGTLDTMRDVAAAKDVPMAFQLVKSLNDGSVVFVNQKTQQFGTFPFPGFAYNPPGCPNCPDADFLPPPANQGLWSTYGLDQGPPLESDGMTLAPPSRYSYVTNGVTNPTLHMQPGEVQRWRLLNATDGDNLQVVLVSNEERKRGLDLNVVAMDAITVPTTYRLKAGDPLVIGPGQRMDVMVKAGRAGTYLLQALDPNSGEVKTSVSPYRSSHFPHGITPAAQPSRHSFDFPSPCPPPGAPASGPNSPCNATTFNYPITLATIEVSGRPRDDMTVPTRLPTPKGLPSIATMLSKTPDKVRNIVFELCGGVTDTAPNPPDGTDGMGHPLAIGNFKNQNVFIPSCPWYFARYDSTYWGNTPFTTLLMMRDADDTGQPSGNPAMPLIDFQKEGLFTPDQPLFPDMIAGNYEEWTVYNRSFSTHPWHLHQNHVLITKINGVTLPQPEWHDTLLVPAAFSPCTPAAAALNPGQGRRAGPFGVRPAASSAAAPTGPDPTNACLGPPNNINLATPGSITFRVYFNPITVGCFVAHCHIIDHEDVGMMQRFDILPAPNQSSNCMLDVAVRPTFQKQLAALKDSFQICTSSPLRFSLPRLYQSTKQDRADAEWMRPDFR